MPDINLETIQSVIVSLVVAFVGTSTFALIVKIALNRLIRTAVSKVKLAENENKITQETAIKIYGALDDFSKSTEQRIDELSQHFKELAKQNEELLKEHKRRDENINELLEESFGDLDEATEKKE